MIHQCLASRLDKAMMEMEKRLKDVLAAPERA